MGNIFLVFKCICKTRCPVFVLYRLINKIIILRRSLRDASLFADLFEHLGLYFCIVVCHVSHKYFLHK